MRIVLTGAVLLVAGAAIAADKPCTKADAAAAEKSIDRVSTWPQLHKAWQDYRHCDKNSIEELYTDALLRLMVDWKNVEALAGTMEKDAQYKEFVYAHLRSPAAKDDLDAVYSRAKASCPKGQEAFCAELAEAAKKK
jgi:hypothetical protein